MPINTPPREEIDEDGSVTVDYSRDGHYAVVTKDPEESFWRLQIEVQDYSFNTKFDTIQAARTVIAAATDLLNRNGITK